MNIEAKETVHKKPHPPPPSLAISPHKSSGRLKFKEARTRLITVHTGGTLSEFYSHKHLGKSDLSNTSSQTYW